MRIERGGPTEEARFDRLAALRANFDHPGPTGRPLATTRPRRGSCPRLGTNRANPASIRWPCAGPPTWLAWGGAVGLVVASALVFCVFDALPFQYFPGHAGLIALRHRFSHSPFEQRYFVFAPELGRSYWILREVGEALVGVIGPGAAVRTLAVLPAIATPAAIAFARARLHGDRSPTGAYSGVALGFGLLTLMGLVSYLFGLSLLIVTLTLWLEILEAADHGQRPGAGREAALAAMACVVWLAHGHAFLLLLAISGITALASRTRWRRLARGRALVPSVALAVAAAWCNRGIPAGSAALGSSPFAPHYEGALAKLGLLVTPTLLTRSGADVLVGLAVWAVIIGASVATARDLGCGRLASAPTGRADIASRAHAKGLLLSIGGVTLAFFALPHEIGWFGFVDGRRGSTDFVSGHHGHTAPRSGAALDARFRWVRRRGRLRDGGDRVRGVGRISSGGDRVARDTWRLYPRTRRSSTSRLSPIAESSLPTPSSITTNGSSRSGRSS